MKAEAYIFFLIILFASAFTALFTRWLIPKLKSKKLGQKILEIGPRWHMSKEGTPTMGGIAFIFAALIAFSTFGIYMLSLDCYNGLAKYLLTAGFILLNGAIGFIDDYLKLFKKQNEGFSARQKFVCQLIVAGGYLAGMRLFGGLNTELTIPFIGRYELGVFYYFIALLLITGIVNSVNLNDGIDGLCSSVSLTVGIFFAYAAFVLCDRAALTISGTVIGVCIGFLVYNLYPAKIFMGDTGSLFLGGAVIGLAFLIDNPMIIVICGIIYVIESLSDIIQVGFYKLTHKRVFKMAPIHHHFEKCGWSENKIVAVFSAITVAACIISAFAL